MSSFFQRRKWFEKKSIGRETEINRFRRNTILVLFCISIWAGAFHTRQIKFADCALCEIDKKKREQNPEITQRQLERIVIDFYIVLTIEFFI